MDGEYGKVGDWIDVPEVRTVVRLSDLEVPDRGAALAESFILTEEVRGHMFRLAVGFERRHGQGVFLRGHYGAGKSHFLAFLHLLFQGRVNVDALIGADRDIIEKLTLLAEKPLKVITLSLVNHSARESLEDIVLEALYEHLGDEAMGPRAELQAHMDTFRYFMEKHQPEVLALFLAEHSLTEEALFTADHLGDVMALARDVSYPFRPGPGRRARFDQLLEELRADGFEGIVILIDELSEFLHSRPGTGLTEDIRFLQYLGELAQEEPIHVIASLQEYLEASEYGLPGDLVRKIKDRYPNNLELSSTHIEELIGKRLIRKKEGAHEVIEAVYYSLQAELSGFPVSYQRIALTYPVHPATVLLLDRLKPLLSRSRGVIDFVHYRIRGSRARGIPGILDAPADTLLTPDAIFDHFRLRIRENVEIAAYEGVVWSYYERNLSAFFEDAELRALAARVVKLLILLAISPEDRPYTVRTIAHALLVGVSRLDPEAGFRVVRDILERLCHDGAYVEESRRVEGRPFDSVFRISLQADLNLILERRIRAARDSLADATDLRVFESLAPEIDPESIPLRRFLAHGGQTMTVHWQRTPHVGRVTMGLLTHLSVEHLSELLHALEVDDLDWAVFIGLPYRLEDQRAHLNEVLLPALRRARPEIARTIVFWLPRPLSLDSDEGDFLMDVVVRRRVRDRAMEEEGTSQSRRLLELLRRDLESERARLEAVFHDLWYQGEVLTIDGPGEDLSNLGRPLFEQTLLALLTPVLGRRFPDHALCAPLSRTPTVADVENVVERFFRPGVYQAKPGGTDPLAARLIALLRPLGLIKKSGHVMTLAVDASRVGPAKAFLGELDRVPRPLSELALFFRKGSWGMAPMMFELLTLGLAYSGAVICYTDGKAWDVGQLSAVNFDRIQSVSIAEVVRLDLTPLESLPFFSLGGLGRGELTHAKQERLWRAVRELRSLLVEKIEVLNHVLRTVGEVSKLEDLETTPIVEALSELREIVAAIPVEASPREGLTRTVKGLEGRLPGRARALASRVEGAEAFLNRHLDRYLAILHYMETFREPSPNHLDAPLREALRRVLDALNRRDVICDASYFVELDTFFREFLQLYSSAYRAEHERECGSNRFHVLDALRASADWALLERCAALRGLAVADRWERIEARLRKVEGGRCRALKSGDLLTSPFCRCGFRLGDVRPEVDVNALREEVRRASSIYLAALASDDNLRAMAEVEGEALAMGDETLAAGVRALASELRSWAADRVARGGVGGVDAPRTWIALLSPEVVAAVNRALEGVRLVAERSLDALVDMLEYRCLSYDETLELVRRWLDGDGDAVRRFRFHRARSS